MSLDFVLHTYTQVPQLDYTPSLKNGMYTNSSIILDELLNSRYINDELTHSYNTCFIFLIFLPPHPTLSIYPYIYKINNNISKQLLKYVSVSQ